MIEEIFSTGGVRYFSGLSWKFIHPLRMIEKISSTRRVRYYTVCAASGCIRLRGRINLNFYNIRRGLWCVISVRGKEGDRDLVYYSATMRYYAITMHFKWKVIVFSSSSSSSRVLHTLSTLMDWLTWWFYLKFIHPLWIIEEIFSTGGV